MLSSENIEYENSKYIIERIKRSSVSLDREMLEYTASKRIKLFSEEWSAENENKEKLNSIVSYFKIINELGINPNKWRMQNVFYSIGTKLYAEMKQKAESGEKHAQLWINLFNELGNYLKVKIF